MGTDGTIQDPNNVTNEPTGVVGGVVGPTSIDPLRTLISSVQGEEGYRNIKVKNLLIDTKKKILNKYLKGLVEDLRKQGQSDAEIIKVLIFLDKTVEEEKLDEELMDIINKSTN